MKQMKIKVIHEKAWGQDRFYPSDEFSTKLLHIMRRDPRASTYTIEQLRGLKDLGFEIDIKEKTVTI